MQTPPLAASARSWSSVRLRGEAVRARAEECETRTGARVTARTSAKVRSETWARSTIMPRRFISAMT